MELKINQNIPDLELDAFYQGEIKKIKLSEFKGKWLVVVFYPADFTFVCPTELEELADLYEEFKKHRAEVVSVSTDTAYVHKAWHDAAASIKKIQFPMIADPTGKMSKAFGVYIEDDGLALRGSFVIDPDGVLKAMEVNDLSIGRNARELLRKVQAAKFVKEHNGKVCPASWTPEKQAMEPSLDLVGKI